MTDPTPVATSPPQPLQNWLDARRRDCDMEVRAIAWEDSREWAFDGDALRHVTGRYFQVVGARRPGLPDQPLLHQPEVGILGFLLRRREGHREVCVQAKPEPGNVGLVQAAPTVQATESNYERVHRGRPTPLLEAFLAPSAGAVLADSLQSEQGTRFFGKWNRNMVVEADAEADDPALAWVGLGDLLGLLTADFAVNTDARSVLATCPWDALVAAPFARWRGRGGLGAALLRSYLTPGAWPDDAVMGHLATIAGPPTEAVGLRDLTGWTLGAQGVERADGGGFRVGHFEVTTSQREVPHWDQPLVATREPGRAVLLGRERGGVLEFAFRARHEIGFLDGAQYGPTTQDDEPVPPSQAVVSCRHSDEGGRFYRCAARYDIRMATAPRADDPAEVWMTLGQVSRLIGHRGVFSNEARSLVSMLLAFL